MDLSNNELFQMLLTDMINNSNNNINNNGGIFNNNYIYSNYNTIFSNIINNIQNDDYISPFEFPLYNSSVPNSQAILHQSLYDRNPIKNVVTEEVKNGLSTIKFKDAKDREKNDKCLISMEKFDEEDDIIQLPCNHCFCLEPIMQWLTEESCECPVCRYKFDSMEKKTQHIESDEAVEIDDMEDLPDLIEIDTFNYQEYPNIVQINENEYDNEDNNENENNNIANISRMLNILFADESFMYNPEVEIESDIIPPDID
jgi:hypothetical protein